METPIDASGPPIPLCTHRRRNSFENNKKKKKKKSKNFSRPRDPKSFETKKEGDDSFHARGASLTSYICSSEPCERVSAVDRVCIPACKCVHLHSCV